MSLAVWLLFSTQWKKEESKSVVVNFEGCVQEGSPVMESYPRQCKSKNGDVFTEVLSPRRDASLACAQADIPMVSLDTVLDKENGSVEVRWSDPETGENKMLLLPYDPAHDYPGCSESAKRILRHIAATSDVPEEMSQVVALVRARVLERSGVNDREVVFVSVLPKEWPNACLGMPGNVPEDTVCAQMITPGYEVMVRAKGQVFIYRTNRDGSQIRPAN